MEHSVDVRYYRNCPGDGLFYAFDNSITVLPAVRHEVDNVIGVFVHVLRIIYSILGVSLKHAVVSQQQPGVAESPI